MAEHRSAEAGRAMVQRMQDREEQRAASHQRLAAIANTTVTTVDIINTRLCANGDGRRGMCYVLAPRSPAEFLCVECADATAQGWASASPDEFTTISIAW